MTTASIQLDKSLVGKAADKSKALNRTTSEQIEHWAKIGAMMESNPDLPYEFVKQAIIGQSKKDAGELEAYSFG